MWPAKFKGMVSCCFPVQPQHQCRAAQLSNPTHATKLHTMKLQPRPHKDNTPGHYHSCGPTDQGRRMIGLMMSSPAAALCGDPITQTCRPAATSEVRSSPATIDNVRVPFFKTRLKSLEARTPPPPGTHLMTWQHHRHTHSTTKGWSPELPAVNILNCAA